MTSPPSDRTSTTNRSCDAIAPSYDASKVASSCPSSSSSPSPLLLTNGATSLEAVAAALSHRLRRQHAVFATTVQLAHRIYDNIVQEDDADADVLLAARYAQLELAWRQLARDSTDFERTVAAARRLHQCLASAEARRLFTDAWQMAVAADAARVRADRILRALLIALSGAAAALKEKIQKEEDEEEEDELEFGQGGSEDETNHNDEMNHNDDHDEDEGDDEKENRCRDFVDEQDDDEDWDDEDVDDNNGSSEDRELIPMMLQKRCIVVAPALPVEQRPPVQRLQNTPPPDPMPSSHLEYQHRLPASKVVEVAHGEHLHLSYPMVSSLDNKFHCEICQRVCDTVHELLAHIERGDDHGHAAVCSRCLGVLDYRAGAEALTELRARRAAHICPARCPDPACRTAAIDDARHLVLHCSALHSN